MGLDDFFRLNRPRFGGLDDKNFFVNLRLGKIIEIENVPKGYARVEWLDVPGSHPEPIPFVFPSVHSATLDTDKDGVTTSSSYGLRVYPTKGDVVVVGFRSPVSPIIIGYFPLHYPYQILPDATRPSRFGAFRSLTGGEASLNSLQQAEVYLDKAGAIQLIAKAQITKTASNETGGDTDSFSDLSPSLVPSSDTSEIVRITIGETYTDETLTSREVSSQSLKTILRVKTKTGVSLKIDTAGNIDLDLPSDKILNINKGTNGVARNNDAVKSTSTEDSAFWTWMTNLVKVFSTDWVVSPLDGGAKLKAAFIAFEAANPTPSDLTSKITEGSSSVKIGE